MTKMRQNGRGWGEGSRWWPTKPPTEEEIAHATKDARDIIEEITNHPDGYWIWGEEGNNSDRTDAIMTLIAGLAEFMEDPTKAQEASDIADSFLDWTADQLENLHVAARFLEGLS